MRRNSCYKCMSTGKLQILLFQCLSNCYQIMVINGFIQIDELLKIIFLPSTSHNMNLITVLRFLLTHISFVSANASSCTSPHLPGPCSGHAHVRPPRGCFVGGACVLLQLFMVASGSQRGSVDVRDAAIVTPQRLEF